MAAVVAGKLAGAVTRALRRGQGTALPGLVASRLDPDVVARLGGQLGGGRVLVTGTNGKTTTSRLLAAMLEAAGRPYLHNREGSNLVRGFASTLVARAGWGGRIAGAEGMTGLFETDEATFPAAVRALDPTVMVVTNLFRDQLDRYGEVETVAGLWRAGLAAAPREATLVLNADDPSVAALADGWSGQVHYFGVDDPSLHRESAGATDARWCACGGDYAYERRYFAHVGWWRCGRCGRARPAPDTEGRELSLELVGASWQVEGLGRLGMGLTGLYNVSNALAAVAAARVLGLPGDAIVEGLAGARAAFGRQEVVTLEGRELWLLLVKNPAGANQVLLLLGQAGGGDRLAVAVLLNDQFADGQDVSWTWDVDFELLAGRVERCWAGGSRAEDLALRLDYAGWPRPLAIAGEPGRLLDAVLAGTRRGERVFVLPTYTAMLELRAELRRRGAVRSALE
jgi:UDP-N-acetylmuramyl tripeptide synthase